MESCRVIKQRFLKAVEGLNYTLNGDQEHCLPSTVNISFHGVDAEGIFLAVKEDYPSATLPLGSWAKILLPSALISFARTEWGISVPNTLILLP